MSHKNNFVAVIKCGGAILREHDGAVTIPFGSEYSILLKNLDGRKASVGVSIDGKSATEGRNLIVGPDVASELMGYVVDGVVRNRFRFVRKTKEIVEYRGDRIDDGIVRVEFRFEKRIVEDMTHHTHVHYDHCHAWWVYYPHDPYGPYYPYYPYYPRSYEPIAIYSATNNDTGAKSVCNASCAPSMGDVMVDTVANNVLMSNVTVDSAHVNPTTINIDEGITVKGSIVHQSLTPVCLGELEEVPTVIVIRLVGTDSGGVAVEAPVTVRTRLECPTCGMSSGSDAQYCARCGTHLL